MLVFLTALFWICDNTRGIRFVVNELDACELWLWRPSRDFFIRVI